MKNPEDWMTKGEAAEFLKLSSSSLHRLVERREIPFYKLGSKPNQKGAPVRFKRKDLEKWLESFRVESA